MSNEYDAKSAPPRFASKGNGISLFRYGASSYSCLQLGSIRQSKITSFVDGEAALRRLESSLIQLRSDQSCVMARSKKTSAGGLSSG